MQADSKRPNRLVFPRWRDFKDTSRSNELLKEKNKFSPVVPRFSIENQLENWRNDKSFIHAIELINSAYLINAREEAREAAEFINENCKDKSHPILVICDLIVSGTFCEKEAAKGITGTDSFNKLYAKIQIKIQEIRIRLRSYPYNSMLYVDLARWYTVIGKLFEANRCIKTAIQLTPTNVFVIRSAVRFYIHRATFDKEGEDSLSFALQLIRKNPTTKSDPWLMATEISLCSHLEKTSSLIKTGFSLIESRNFSPFALSELSATLATEEMKHSISKSKKLFSSSLINPNENTIAQAQWAVDKVGDLPINFANVNSFEASAYRDMQLENWEKAFDESLNWLVDQPFSSEPIKQASYLSTIANNDTDLSIKICDFGLKLNHTDFTFLNNKTYSLALDGRSDEAEKIFGQILYESLTEAEKVTYNATKGLLFYSKGEKMAGENSYNYAEELAKKIKNETLAFRVRTYKVQTELIFGSRSEAVGAIAHLISDSEKYKNPGIKKVIKNIKARLNEASKEN